MRTYPDACELVHPPDDGVVAELKDPLDGVLHDPVADRLVEGRAERRGRGRDRSRGRSRGGGGACRHGDRKEMQSEKRRQRSGSGGRSQVRSWGVKRDRPPAYMSRGDVVGPLTGCGTIASGMLLALTAVLAGARALLSDQSRLVPGYRNVLALGLAIAEPNRRLIGSARSSRHQIVTAR